jgi:GT2 family glycosyltransferase
VQVIVADNADDAATRRTSEGYADRLELVYLVETAPGKNSALNTALPRATGDLFIFTDDDIVAPSDWLAETAGAASRWPEHAVFGGRVLPMWPSACPDRLNDVRYLGPCFTVLDRDAAEGPSTGFTPFGPNMAIRRDVFDSGVRFDPRVGPRNASYIMGSETELLRRLKKAGHVPVYIPGSIVYHRIRQEQLTDRWLYGRAFRYGRLVELRRQEGAGTAGRWPLHLVPALARDAARAAIASLGRDRKVRFDSAMELATRCGQIYQAWQPLNTPPASPPPPVTQAPRDVVRT